MEQVNLPTKTKIAAWWMRIIGIVMIFPVILFFFLFFFGLPILPAGMLGYFILGIVCLFSSLIFIISGTLILRKRKLGWWMATIIYGLSLLYCSFYPPFFWFYFYLGAFVPLILLLLDRKNFWKIAS